MKILFLLFIGLLFAGCVANINLRGSFTQNHNREIYGESKTENTEETAINADKSTDLKADVKTGGEK